MSAYTLASRAEHDLEQIFSYIADEHGEDRALAVHEALLSAFRFLADARHAGRERLDLTPEGVRWWNVDNFVVLYLAESSPIVVLRVIHGMRDLERLV